MHLWTPHFGWTTLKETTYILCSRPNSWLVPLRPMPQSAAESPISLRACVWRVYVASRRRLTIDSRLIKSRFVAVTAITVDLRRTQTQNVFRCRPSWRPRVQLYVGPFLAKVNLRSRSVYAIARPSVCRLSVDCNVRAPYSGGSAIFLRH